MPESSTPHDRAAVTIHVARQPVHDVSGHLFGYELLFRAAADLEHATGTDGDAATTATILAAFSEFGGENLLAGRPGLINLTRSFLVGDLPLPFAPGEAVLEILETVEVDEQVVAGAQRLVAEGYQLALDDFVWRPGAERLLDLAHLVKIDVLALDWQEVLATMDRCRNFGVTFLAEKIEDAQVLRRCQAAGFELFQGFHLGRPETWSSGTVTPTHAMALDLLGRLSDPAATFTQIEESVRRDPALSYRLLRIANSASSGVAGRVSSVRDALVLLGLAKLRAWLVLLSLDAGGDGCAAEVAGALARARTCETVARLSGTARPDVAFTAGLLHGVASVLGVPPPYLPDSMPSLAPELAGALAGVPGPLGDVLQAVLAYESGDLLSLAGIGLPLGVWSEAYLSAIAWTTLTTRAATPRTDA